MKTYWKKLFLNKDFQKIASSLLKISFVVAVVVAVQQTDFRFSLAYFISDLATPSSYAQTGDWTPPPVPTLISPCGITRNTNGMVMDWTDVTDDMSNPVYYIYQSARDAAFTNIAYTSVSLASSQIPAPGTPEGAYWWHVKACDSVNNCSAWSSVCTVTVDNTAPTMPGKMGWTTENPLVGSDYTYGSDFDHYFSCGNTTGTSPLTNLWGPSTDTYGPVTYDREVYASETAPTPFYTISLGTNYQNGTFPYNGIYWVRVRAHDAAGNTSAWTPRCSVTYDNTPPAAPLFWTEEDTTQVKIDWQLVSGAVGYRVYRSTDNVSFAQIADVVSPGTTYTDSSLTSNTDYYYKVTAYNGLGTESNASLVTGKYAGTMDVVVDDDAMNSDFNSSGFVYKTGQWDAYSMNNVPSVLQNAAGGDDWSTNYSPNGQTFTWETNSGLTGFYDVYTQYICDPARNVALYDIFNGATKIGSGSADQRLRADQVTACPPQAGFGVTEPKWAKLGTYRFTGGHGVVTVNAGTNPGYILADAVGFKRVRDLDTTPPKSVITTGLTILGTDINNPDGDNDASGYHNHTINLLHWNGRIDGIASDAGSGVKEVWLSIHRLRLLPYFDGYWDGSSWASGGTEETVRVLATGTTTWYYQLASHPTGLYTIKSHAIDNEGNVENTYTLVIDNSDEDLITPTVTPAPTIAPLVTPTPTPTAAFETAKPTAEIMVADDKKTVSFTVKKVAKYVKLSYELSYDTAAGPQGVVGETELKGENEYTKSGITLGTCSTGGTCTYHKDVKNFKLQVTLVDAEGKETVITQTHD